MSGKTYAIAGAGAAGGALALSVVSLHAIAFGAITGGIGYIYGRIKKADKVG